MLLFIAIELALILLAVSVLAGCALTFMLRLRGVNLPEIEIDIKALVQKRKKRPVLGV
jgi:hypothetical protein